jgi:hypothetical protein
MKPKAWIHVCAQAPTAGGVQLPGHSSSCTRCGARRPA